MIHDDEPLAEGHADVSPTEPPPAQEAPAEEAPKAPEPTPEHWARLTGNAKARGLSIAIGGMPQGGLRLSARHRMAAIKAGWTSETVITREDYMAAIEAAVPKRTK